MKIASGGGPSRRADASPITPRRFAPIIDATSNLARRGLSSSAPGTPTEFNELVQSARPKPGPRPRVATKNKPLSLSRPLVRSLTREDFERRRRRRRRRRGLSPASPLLPQLLGHASNVLIPTQSNLPSRGLVTHPRVRARGMAWRRHFARHANVRGTLLAIIGHDYRAESGRDS